MINVFVVVGVRIYRDCLERHLANSPPIVIVGGAAGPAEAHRLIPRLRPDVLLLDLGVDAGLAFAREVRDTAPDTKVIGLADTGTAVDVISCVEAGMLGYLTTEATLPELATAIGRADRGEATCPAQATAQVFHRLATWASGRRTPPGNARPLTARELEILWYIDAGLTNKEIARKLSISVSTVKNHVHHLLDKLKVKSRMEAPAALRNGWPKSRGSEGDE
ncbi:MAG TPA: response regulator transcription factor [Actinophytocola sp.]|uniref:response regulator transcription factor n=1 Tax=Actinophytocola sp. TaxID=1872138 RepID=UPI002DB98F83|nr:response regulator transcription factor [Actinophytocola sp.]HEU5469186.1 response regulator transcription factor [Actinophytocola sp.]